MKNMIVGFFSNLGNSSLKENGLVRFFETEYSKEYRCAVRNGVQINAAYVKDFLKYSKKTS